MKRNEVPTKGTAGASIAANPAIQPHTDWIPLANIRLTNPIIS